MKLLSFIIILFAAAFWQRHLFVGEHAVDRNLFYDESLFFRNARGLLIHYTTLAPIPDEPKGIVLVIHGYTEHSGYYVGMCFLSFFLFLLLFHVPSQCKTLQSTLPRS